MTRCAHCQQPIKCHADIADQATYWWHAVTGKALCVEIPDFPLTIATPEAQK